MPSRAQSCSLTALLEELEPWVQTQDVYGQTLEAAGGHIEFSTFQFTAPLVCFH